MSDDIPVIFAQDLCAKPGAPQPVALFLSALSVMQMQQYATSGWRVLAAKNLPTAAPIKLPDVPAEECDVASVPSPYMISCEAPALDAAAMQTIERLKPEVVKINGAFHKADPTPEAFARKLGSLGYTMLGAHWRNDNSFAVKMLSYIGKLSVFEPPEWNRLDVIAIRDADVAKAVLNFGRLYAGEEKRIGELRVAQSIRNDYIARLEDALAVHQSRGTFKLK